jgi:glycosyltransferase involved in cell wall biosynthesis
VGEGFCLGKIIASIIVPTLNEEKHLSHTIISLNNQTTSRENYEIIVSDSSSHDGTVKLAKNLMKKGLINRVVVCKRQSAGFGRNFGAKFARGELLGFTDADTIVAPTWVEGLVECLNQKGVVACTGPLENIEKHSLQINLFYKFWNFQTWVSRRLGFAIIPGYNFCVRKKEFYECKEFPPGNQMCEDLDLSTRLSKVGKIGFSNKIKVKTSARRQEEIHILWHIWSGLRYALTKQSITWDEYRKDFVQK